MTSVLTPGVVYFSLTGCFVVVLCVCVCCLFFDTGGQSFDITVYFFMVIGVLRFGILTPGSSG